MIVNQAPSRWPARAPTRNGSVGAAGRARNGSHFTSSTIRRVNPANYSWQTLYDQVIDLTRYSFSTRAIFRRFLATQGVTARWMNLVRAVSTEGFGRAKYYQEIRDRLDTDPQFPPYFEQESSVLPQFYKNIVRQDLGPLMEWLPES